MTYNVFSGMLNPAQSQSISVLACSLLEDLQLQKCYQAVWHIRRNMLIIGRIYDYFKMKMFSILKGAFGLQNIFR